jgi:hypothetical protein
MNCDSSTEVKYYFLLAGYIYMAWKNIILLLLLLLIVLCILFHIQNPSNQANHMVLTQNKHYEGMINLEPLPDDTNHNNLHNNKFYLWTYWELVNGARNPPPYIELCFDTMKRNGTKYFNLVILDEKTVFHYLPDLRKDINELPIAFKTDYIRVALLYRYGGVWLDGDTIMMTDFENIASLLKNKTDFIGFGCTRYVCKNQEGYGRPSNGVMGSAKHGKLISRCLDNLNEKLDKYFKQSNDKRKAFNYYDLGKKIIWKEYENLINQDPSYRYYHAPPDTDGTRDRAGHWIAKDLIFSNNINLLNKDKLLVVMLVNSSYCGNDPKFNWFCGLTKNQILDGTYFISSLFRSALSYDPVKKHVF